jgi:DNA ligase D-like protein (predicted ligase)
MNKLLARLDEADRNKLERQTKPQWIAPMLATLTEARFSDKHWLFERKFDGIRCLAYCTEGEISLFSRNRKRLDRTYPELLEALAGQNPANYVLDGEIVAFLGALTSFSRLQQRSGIHDPDEAYASGIAVYYYLFDILWLDDCRLTALPLRARKSTLKDAFQFHDPLRYATHRNGAGEALHREACRKGWEGIIGKRSSAGYVGKRSREWLKLKCVNQQEFVIGGYTDPEGERTGFGALLLGYYEHDALRYAGKVGTGFDERQLNALHDKFLKVKRTSTAFVDKQLPTRGVHWVKPNLVAEIGFTEWTDDGRLRHPRFLGLREDKSARKVVRERPA